MSKELNKSSSVNIPPTDIKSSKPQPNVQEEAINSDKIPISNLILSPTAESLSNNGRRFSLGNVMDNQLPLSAVFDNNIIGSELGNEFSTLNEFMNLLDPNHLSVDTFNNEGTASNNENGINGQKMKPISELINTKPTFNKNYTSHNFPTLTTNDDYKVKSQRRDDLRGKKRASYTVSAKEKFFLTAAAPSAVLHARERLTEVIKAKLDAGLLKPYDYRKGYDRLHDFLSCSGTTIKNKKRIYKVLNEIRGKYAEIINNLKSYELVLVEESFEVMLLSLERVFSTIATPSCCWRRTGEIYRGNQEFATLAGCDIEDLRDGKLAIYELLDEESYCKYFELFGKSSLNPIKKTVLTHCILKNRNVNCCFSFTIKRDEYNMPMCIIGNFLPSE
ncbi:uncharacterized protein HGUI_03952 [Hanseniaspora guilliermondii]|uniref:ERT1/acuK family PAS domain-containing protein n=1 Tax=Hanseniaspora guilliermondii TaxID=56406 RepID=A0A1L0D3L1_9ASCO|nr:uncharacterized protein HGUI_03952 [Hanseniaspora guilliermondii]